MKLLNSVFKIVIVIFLARYPMYRFLGSDFNNYLKIKYQIEEKIMKSN